MAKKLSFLITAVALLAFAVPSPASANTATCKKGTSGVYQSCPLGTVITATGSDIKLNTQLIGVIGCKTLNFKAKVTTNGELLTAKGESEKPTQTGCLTSEGGNIVVETVEVTKLETKGTDVGAGATKTGTKSFIAKVVLPTGAICTFTGTNVPGSYVTTASPTKLTSTDPATRSNITSTGGCGKAQLLGSFNLETVEVISGSTVVNPVIIH